MIHFIICDDIEKTREEILQIISKFMMSRKLEYKTFVFDDYDDEFLKMVDEKLSFKIYILDIEVPTRTGIDVARIIRNKDEDSAIIFLTGHEELGPKILEKDITFLAFINKFDNYKERLELNIRKAISALEKKRCLRFEDHGTMYVLPYKDILYITKDTVSRKTIIVTEYKKFEVYKPLNYFIETLSDGFIQTHRACLVNKERIRSFNRREKIIIFDNGTSFDLISTRFNGKELAK